MVCVNQKGCMRLVSLYEIYSNWGTVLKDGVFPKILKQENLNPYSVTRLTVATQQTFFTS